MISILLTCIKGGPIQMLPQNKNMKSGTGQKLCKSTSYKHLTPCIIKNTSPTAFNSFTLMTTYVHSHSQGHCWLTTNLGSLFHQFHQFFHFINPK